MVVCRRSENSRVMAAFATQEADVKQHARHIKKDHHDLICDPWSAGQHACQVMLSETLGGAGVSHQRCLGGAASPSL